MARKKTQPGNEQPDGNMSLLLWVESSEKIASFHEVDGWEKMEFTSGEYCQNYIDSLIISHYRFQ